MRPSATRAFTLVEIMIVVLLLGILLALVMPRFTDASERTRDAAAQTTILQLRGQIELFKSQHGETPPQNGSLWTLLQHSSNVSESATTTPTGTAFGPYFRTDPLNPWNGSARVSATLVDPGAGWFYSAGPSTFELRLRNLDGTVSYQY